MFASRTAFNVRSVEADRLVREGLLTTEKAVEGEVIHNEMIITSNSKNRNRCCCCIMIEIWCFARHLLLACSECCRAIHQIYLRLLLQHHDVHHDVCCTPGMYSTQYLY